MLLLNFHDLFFFFYLLDTVLYIAKIYDCELWCNHYQKCNYAKKEFCRSAFSFWQWSHCNLNQKSTSFMQLIEYVRTKKRKKRWHALLRNLLRYEFLKILIKIRNAFGRILYLEIKCWMFGTFATENRFSWNFANNKSLSHAMFRTSFKPITNFYNELAIFILSNHSSFFH